jgi:hypothetical protein
VGHFDAGGRQDLGVANVNSDDVSVLLNQLDPLPNEPPVADAGFNVVGECTSPEGAAVTLDASGSTDPNSTPGTSDDIAMFEWFEGERFLGTGMTLRIDFSLGPHLVTLKVTDTFGEVDTDEVMATVVDTTPPEISQSLAPALLWPPNHRMVDVNILVSSSDLCSSSSVFLESIVSNEPDDGEGNGDGKTVDDIQGATVGTGDTHFQLRAERAGIGDGRIYTVTYRAVDGFGNGDSVTPIVFVPHDMGGVTEPLMIWAFENGVGTVAEWSDVPGALFYNVVRGELKDIREKNNVFHLGQLTCIASATTQASTVGSEDPEIPPLGEAFFYLVEYNDGFSSGYGTESAFKPRFGPPGQGNCP